ncbi:MAG: hypothetical protein ABI158_02520 [Edaphobacter sp.]
MKATRHFGVVILLLASYLTPAMACVVSNAQMNAQERACCRTMSKKCGQVDMPASHGCCHKTLSSNHANALYTKTTTFHPAVTAVVSIALSELLAPATSATEWVDRPDYSPPESPPSSVLILRI